MAKSLECGDLSPTRLAALWSRAERAGLVRAALVGAPRALIELEGLK